MIPEFRSDGYLPNGLHLATESEITFRIGGASRRRRKLTLRLRSWIALARAIAARRLLLDGSFVTAKPEPNDLDAVVLLPTDFPTQVEQGQEPALELEELLVTRRPEELFAAEDETDWNQWVEFFSRSREPDGRQKGLIEVKL